MTAAGIREPFEDRPRTVISMSSRERWTIYPLLFLALGLAIRGIVAPSPEIRCEGLEASHVTCGELRVVGPDGKILVHLGRVVGDGGGRIDVKDAAGVDVLGIGTGSGRREGAVEFFDADGNRISTIDGTGE